MKAVKRTVLVKDKQNTQEIYVDMLVASLGLNKSNLTDFIVCLANHFDEDMITIDLQRKKEIASELNKSMRQIETYLKATTELGIIKKERGERSTLYRITPDIKAIRNRFNRIEFQIEKKGDSDE